MYYIFHATPIKWQDKEQYAHVEPAQPPTTDIARLWWNCEPLQLSFPPLRYLIDGSAPLPDNYVTGDIFDLYSERFASVMAMENIAFEKFPITLIDRLTRQKISQDYVVFHLLQSLPAIDRQQSIVSKLGLEKIVLTEQLLASNLLVVRDQYWSNIVLIHHQLKQKLENMAITGCRYTSVEV